MSKCVVCTALNMAVEAMKHPNATCWKSAGMMSRAAKSSDIAWCTPVAAKIIEERRAAQA